MKRALIVVDPQNDFCRDGSLAVPDGDEVVPAINRLLISNKFRCVATQDYHPSFHKSFAANHEGKKPYDVIDLNGLQQVLWPKHCEWGTKGAEFHKNLLMGKLSAIFRKGMDPEVDSYSGFFDNARRNSTGLNGYLKELKVEEVYVVGLATDYCVKFTALDAISLGFKTYVVLDACRAVNVNPDDGNKAIESMKTAGVVLVKNTDELVKTLQ